MKNKTSKLDHKPDMHQAHLYHPTSSDAYTQELLTRIIKAIRGAGTLDAHSLDQVIRAFNRTLPDGIKARSKKMLLPYYAYVRQNDQACWKLWNIDKALERQIILTLRMKPSRTSNGIATVTVLTKPWMCGGGCLFCPRDVRMPKSYLHDEPACQRAELNTFDPYLQVTSRLSVLEAMGHRTHNVELIVLGGTWDDYPAPYRVWFCKEMYRALNDASVARADERQKIIDWYHRLGITEDRNRIKAWCALEQSRVDSTSIDYNQAIDALYRTGAWERAAHDQVCDPDDLFAQKKENEHADHRCIGLSVETRPEKVTDENLSFMQSLGVTRVQLGVQSLDNHVLKVNSRHASVEAMERAFWLVRMHGLKLHAHFMANLYQSNPAIDTKGYAQLVQDPHLKPDEIKLYPCALVRGTGLYRLWERHAWKPYTHDELLRVLSYDLTETPAYIRVSRMIRDIPSTDIEAGNRKINLRQNVQHELRTSDIHPDEIRERSKRLSEVDADTLHIDVLSYTTQSPDGDISDERFIQWITPENAIVGFARLSVPQTDENQTATALLREVQIFDDEDPLFAHFPGESSSNTESTGDILFQKIVERAFREARRLRATQIAVNCACGSREKFRTFGFTNKNGTMIANL